MRSAEEVVMERDRLHPIPPLTTKHAVRMPAVDMQLVDACQTYVSAVPGGKLAVECDYQAARTYFRWNHFAESTPRFLMFKGAHPDAPRTAQVVALLLDTYAYLEDYEGLFAATAAVRDNPQLVANPDVRALLITAEQ